MKIIQSNSVGRLHELVVSHIVKYGHEVVTEDGEVTLETEPITLITKTPFDSYRISNNSPFSKSYMEEYTNDLINGK